VCKQQYHLSKKLDDYAQPTAMLMEEGDEDGHVDEAPMMHQGQAIFNRRAIAGPR
jgi:hypothetical protein